MAAPWRTTARDSEKELKLPTCPREKVETKSNMYSLYKDHPTALLSLPAVIPSSLSRHIAWRCSRGGLDSMRSVRLGIVSILFPDCQPIQHSSSNESTPCGVSAWELWSDGPRHKLLFRRIPFRELLPERTGKIIARIISFDGWGDAGELCRPQDEDGGRRSM